MATLEEHLIFLASPGDVKKERGLVAEIIDRLNRSVARKRGLHLRLISWEKDAFPAYGSDPQKIINQQIAEMSTYTLFVGIMWNRLGSPTPRGDSGTVEEFTRATASFAIHGRPHIWFYFRNSAAKLDTQEQLDQRAKVLAFKKGIQANALTYDYKDTRVFKEQLQDHLLMWLDTIPDREKTTITKAAESQSPEEQALAAAKRSLDANSISDQKERVKIKDSCGNEIAELILREKLTKDWVVEQVPVQACTPSARRID